ncbi:uncharacterized protein PFL1_02018 [Pseudozyma flocculosa PF-1]|uniref:Related to AIF1 - mitochondrial cell death effector n=1 Tax=Pseudozyma flocculosa TaxID=84751 RepID=A0A5C3F0X1_9BASI|nr:uncharacterized protein PFL1_02018 [Pseudozyma flocculosa PF-1]EPQ30492.1 hypothetical protein PFL1_02018 [Pseudozyma flocculosa PF-1]SPO37576.1 related to AIF1 - mitochondrial cell death effector [Pseudozyma flocculosa]
MSSSSTAAEPLKNVVVVGAASGIVTANLLASKLPPTHRLVLIEANEVAFWPIGALRAAVEQAFEKEIVAPLTHLYQDHPRHVVLNKTRVVGLEPNAVIVDRLAPEHLDLAASGTPAAGASERNGGGHRIEFDRAVLALGSSYSFPSRTVAPEEAKILESFQTAQREIEAAQHLLVIGGGPVGVEFVGEVLERHPQKASGITLVTNSNRLVSKDGKQEGVHDKLLSQLQKKGINIVFEDEVDFGDVPLRTGAVEGGRKTFKTKNKGVEIHADYLLDGTGGKPNTSLVASVDASVLNGVGAIKVDAALRVKSDGSSSAFDWSRYLATGDCNDLPCAKTWFAAEGQAKTAAHNVLELIKAEGGPTASHPKVQDASIPPNMIVVPLGKRGGASQLFFVSLGGWFTSLAKGNSLFVSQFKGYYR